MLGIFIIYLVDAIQNANQFLTTQWHVSVTSCPRHLLDKPVSYITGSCHLSDIDDQGLDITDWVACVLAEVIQNTASLPRSRAAPQ